MQLQVQRIISGCQEQHIQTWIEGDRDYQQHMQTWIEGDRDYQQHMQTWIEGDRDYLVFEG